MNIPRRYPGCITTIALFLTIVSAAQAKYSGGTGDPNDPYQIVTINDLMLLGDSPEDYDKHFILIADIDLDPNLPGRKVFDRAVIAPAYCLQHTSHMQGTPTAFTGVFDGNGHAISNMTITGEGYLGLFGLLESSAEVKGLGVVNVNITGSDPHVGGLVGGNGAYSNRVGGKITSCYSTGVVTGTSEWPLVVGGLIGSNCYGAVTLCYSSAAVNGKSNTADGLWGDNTVGGLVGVNHEGIVAQCYSIGEVSGNGYVGGLVGYSDPLDVISSVWDIKTSGQLGSAGGMGLTTDEMMNPYMLGLNGFANDPNWILDAGRDYPRLVWEGKPGKIIPEPKIDWLEGQGIQNSPYRIGTADQLILLSKASIFWDKYFVLNADIDLDPNLPGRSVFGQAIFPSFSGVFDGNSHVISNIVIEGTSYLGFFGHLVSGAEVRNLGYVDFNVKGSGYYVGGLVGRNVGYVTACYSTGMVSATGLYANVGGLVGRNMGYVTACYSAGVVNAIGQSESVGGLVGGNSNTVICCYSMCTVNGEGTVGGLVGWNWGSITASYSAGRVIGVGRVGGLVGGNYSGLNPEIALASHSFWDIETSGQTESSGGIGKTTSEMKDILTYQEAGWDFRGESADGLHESWQMSKDNGYPVLSILHGYIPPQLDGLGTPQEPYLINDALELGAILYYSPYAYYCLAASIDLSGIRWSTAVVPSFAGTFDGNNLTISHLYINGQNYLGLFGQLAGAEVRDLGVVDVNITGIDTVGGFVGYNRGRITKCYSTGVIRASGSSSHSWVYGGIGGLIGISNGDVTSCYVDASIMTVGESVVAGGLIGHNSGSVNQCYSIGTVSGNYDVGGLMGRNTGEVHNCYSSSTVNGERSVGGLVGSNYMGFRGGHSIGFVVRCYSTGLVNATGDRVGGLVGSEWEDSITASFWDTDASHQIQTWYSHGTGKTTAEMQTATTFLDAGWDFVDETANGTDDIWWILEGQDYPRLWWEDSDL